jgi:ERCC4-type nuclease
MAATPLSSRKLAMKGIKRQQRTQNEGGDGDEDMWEAIRASLQETKKPPTMKRDIFAIDEISDDELPGPVFSPSPIRKKRKTNPLSEAKKPPAKNRGEICCINSESDSDDELFPRKLMVSPRNINGRKKDSANQQKKLRAVTSEELPKAATPSSINLCESSDSENDSEDDMIENRKRLEEPIDLSNSQLSQDPDFIRESLKEPIDLSNSQLLRDPNCIDDGDGNVGGDEIMIVEDATKTPEPTLASEKNYSPKGRCPKKNNNDLLTVSIDNRERNRNATPRTLRMELTRHLATGPLSDVWPSTLPPGRVEEAGLEWGDIQYSVQCSNNSDQPKRRLGVSIERKRVNDLVQRSSDGDHLIQLIRMKQHCSLSVLLIENDTRTARNVTPYNALNKEGFDPMDPTIRCEDDVYRMFGRILLSCDSIMFFQTRDEQASLRAIAALGLMAVFAPSKYTKELEDSRINLASEERTATTNNNSKGAQALSDQLKQVGIPWRLAKRVANVVGGPIELKALYDSCCNETAKSKLLSYIIATGDDHDQGDMQSSAAGWSDAIYRINAASPQSPSSDEKRLSGEAALILHKELIEDHGFYLSTLYQGNCPEETLEKVLDNPSSSSPTHEEMAPRHVTISLTNDQATKYFSPSTPDDSTFYKVSILSDEQSISQSGAITIRTVSRSFASNALSVFEFEGSDIVDLIRDSWSSKKGNNFVSLAKLVAHVVDNICHERGRGRSSGIKRILMVCGLQPALDANAKKSGYATETRSVVDLVFAELLLCYDVTILQASRKNSDDRVNLVKQLALACFHFDS